VNERLIRCGYTRTVKLVALAKKSIRVISQKGVAECNSQLIFE